MTCESAGDAKLPLSANQILDFERVGHTTLEAAFPRSVGEAVCRSLGPLIGIDLGDPDQWKSARVWLRENLSMPPFTSPLTNRFVAAVDQLVGRDRWVLRPTMGWWPVTFPGFDEVSYGRDWHVDGNFRHFTWSPEQALLPIFCFTDVSSGDGGTLLAQSSHRVAAKVLAAAGPKGLSQDDLGQRVARVLDDRGWNVVELVAHCGDVVLCHPLLLHASNPNRGQGPRVMAQPRFDLVGPKRSYGDDLSPMERTSLPVPERFGSPA